MLESQNNQQSHKKYNDSQKSNNTMSTNMMSNNTESYNDPESNPKNEVFKLFIENKNLIKQGLYLLEICQNAARSTDLATDRRGHDEPSWTLSSHT